MSHEVETMAYNMVEVPWHSLGCPVVGDLTPEQMMQKAGVDWTVSEHESFVEVDGVRIPTGQKTLVRDSDLKVLTNVGGNWNPVQNQTAFEFFNEFVMAGDMNMETAGSLRGGQIVWALAKTNEGFTLTNGDSVESYLLFSNPHQYGKCIDVRFVNCRVVCQNTMTIALKEQGVKAVRLNHTKKFNGDEVKEVMGLNHQALLDFKEKSEYMFNKQMTVAQMSDYFKELFGASKKDEDKLSRNGQKAVELLETQPGKEFGYGTAWHAFNTVTYMTDHILGRSADTRLQSAWYGANATLKERALELALAV